VEGVVDSDNKDKEWKLGVLVGGGTEVERMELSWDVSWKIDIKEDEDRWGRDDVV
jgi:hypothetical protein